MHSSPPAKAAATPPGVSGRAACTVPAAWSSRPVAAVAVLGACLAQAGLPAQAAPDLQLRIEPSLSAGISTIDRYRSDAGDRIRSDAVATVTPGLRFSLRNRGGRVQASVNYGLSAVVYPTEPEESRLRNRLSGRVRAELVENHLDLNLTGSISQQPISIFGRQTDDESVIDENQAEVRNFSVQPVLRGVLGGVVALRASATAGFSDASRQGFRSTGQNASLALSPARAARLGWSLSGSRSISDFQGGRETTSDRVVGGLSYRPDVDWLLSLRSGWERTDIASVQSQSYDNWGAGVVWTPTPRTSVSVDADRRFFGNSYGVSIGHRHKRTVWSYSASRGLSEFVGEGAVAVSAYDLFFQLFASQEPDPERRDQLVRDFLDRNGIPPETVIGGLGYLVSAASLQERHQLSMGMSFRRASLSASVYTSRSERVDKISGAIDDLSRGAVRQHGVSASIGYSLSPRDSVSLRASASRTDPSGDRAGSSLVSLGMSWSTRLSQRTSFSVGLRHTAYDRADEDDYTDTALTTALRTSFF
ncbi:MAG: TIGR03016 family PEP-CTERM system-associated outer membrane protein [Burkholderiales bacterium]|nr:TIGR03016 family PEP-CTERM system-associated outer membrane protein [Burkholderiales bacterium]